MRKASFTANQPIPTLRLFGPQDVTAALSQEYPDLDSLRMETHAVQAFQTWQDRAYSFTAYRAYHAVDHLDALFYSVEEGQRAFLYATDTGSFPAETWSALSGRSFDVIILEETLGIENYTQHMGFDTFLEHIRRMRAEGMLRPGGLVIAHHLSHSGNPPHARLEAILEPHGVEVAYDGFEINLD
jgi:phosphoribosyl 1,2-cyclic phosphate phosphodiesterase